MRAIRTVDYHTAGEPFRIVVGGVDVLPGPDVPARRAHAMAHLDDVRALLVNEPRGHADMYGCFVTPPDDGDGDLGVVFFHNDGFSTACGHGTIALVTWALDDGVIARTGAQTRVVVDAPSGRLVTTATSEDGRVSRVAFRNVAAYVHATGLEVALPDRAVSVDVAFGGAFYAVLPAAEVDCAVVAEDLPALVAAGRAIKAAIEAEHEVVHPTAEHLRDVYGVIFVDQTRRDGDVLEQRNVAIFADGEVDRSPTGSGVSARLALLDADGTLPRGHTLVTTGIAGQSFVGRVVDDAEVDGRPAVVPEVTGSAHRTGTHTFTLDPHDPLGTGFLLR
ncbi:proline racemase family protein [Salsipaludibacter albus]|uniref:proline racemase family protein n=1 Tax=Salsipaludibacter albus TaxID=2849650 RepID=UPI001EE4CDDB|nr:proline racemase family protein [Salsipaludibacter albus]